MLPAGMRTFTAEAVAAARQSPCSEHMEQPEDGNNCVCDLAKLTPSEGCRADRNLPALTNGVLLSVPWMWREDL